MRYWKRWIHRIKPHKSACAALLCALLAACVAPVAMVTQDVAERELWRKRAMKGEPEAQYRLGKTICCGYGAFYDSVKALTWWCLAARSGHREAQFEVGKLYDNVYGLEEDSVPIDPVMAYVWYDMAARNGQEKAEYHRQALRRKMSQAEYWAAEALLRDPKRLPCSLEELNRLYTDHQVVIVCADKERKECS